MYRPVRRSECSVCVFVLVYACASGGCIGVMYTNMLVHMLGGHTRAEKRAHHPPGLGLHRRQLKVANLIMFPYMRGFTFRCTVRLCASVQQL